MKIDEVRIDEVRIDAWTGLYMIVFSNGIIIQTPHADEYIKKLNEFFNDKTTKSSAEGLKFIFKREV